MFITLQSDVLCSSDELSIRIDEDYVDEVERATKALTEADSTFEIVSALADAFDAEAFAEARNDLNSAIAKAANYLKDLQAMGLQYVRGWSVYEELCDALSSATDTLDASVMDDAA